MNLTANYLANLATLPARQVIGNVLPNACDITPFLDFPLPPTHNPYKIGPEVVQTIVGRFAAVVASA